MNPQYSTFQLGQAAKLIKKLLLIFFSLLLKCLYGDVSFSTQITIMDEL